MSSTNHEEKSYEQLLRSVPYYIEKATLANAYIAKNKKHTAVIIIVAIVDFLAQIAAKRDAENPMENSNFASLMELAKNFLSLDCERSSDRNLISSTKVIFYSICSCLQMQNDKDSDNTECSCDDCQNGTCSTYGPLGGCRIDRTRE